MASTVLTNQNEFPTEAVIHAHLGKAAPLWQAVFEHIHTQYPSFTAEWRYYQDGKSWLLKVAQKSKTVCWISVTAGSFTMGFYFTDKAEAAILGSPIAKTLKEQFRIAQRHGKIRGLSVTLQKKRDIEDAKALIALKLSVK